ncbi:MAG TPA: hypothetical protein RMH99_18500 [Sandaracinaceae bacterium LLY-WYZ-13_1]|nr:hypothetical protein [Sandaracinaceae bacterium LLY-WYZ-13_1]
MSHTTFEAALSWDDPGEPVTEMVRRLELDRASDAAFGLLERGPTGWTLCIPDGAEAAAVVDEEIVDLGRLHLEPSGERHLPVRAGLRARVRMGSFRFEVRPTA